MENIYKYKLKYLKASFRDIINKIDLFLKEIEKLEDEIKSRSLIFNFDLIDQLKKDISDFRVDILNTSELLKKINSNDSTIIKTIIDKYQEKYRYDLSKLSCFITGLDWQSISYESSRRPNILFFGEFDYRGILGYKRIIYPMIEAYESLFLKNCVEAVKKDNLFCAFTNSGQGAYSVAESLITKFYLEEGDNIAYIKDAYYETRFGIDLLKGFKKNIIVNISSKKIAEEIIKNNVRFLTIEPIYNSKLIKILDIPKLIKILNKHEWKQDIYLVIDNSMLGGCFHPFKFRLNPRINIILIESLIKYRQMGLDRVNAGIIILEKKHKGKVVALRGALGCILQDIDLLRLPLMQNNFFKLRMKLLSDNALYVSEKLQYFLKCNNLAIKGVSYPGLKNKNSRNKNIYPYLGSVFTLVPKDGYLISKDTYLKFILKVIEIAHNKKIYINHGTSFGFENSRIALADTDGGTFENPYIRFSVGCENKADLDILIEVIEYAILYIFSDKNPKNILIKSDQYDKKNKENIRQNS